MVGLKIAVASKGFKGLDEEVSEVFGKAETFTVLTVEECRITEVKTLRNPGADYRHGSGPIAAKALIDEGVDAVIALEIGPGVLEILSNHDVKVFKAKPGEKVGQAAQRALKEM